MTREELNQLNALVMENDLIAAALANIEAGGLLCVAAIGPTPEYEAPVPVMAMPPAGIPMPPMQVSVPVRGDIPDALMTELAAYLTARQSAVQADLAQRGATADPAAAGQQMQRRPEPTQMPAPQQPQVQRPQQQPPQRPQR